MSKEIQKAVYSVFVQHGLDLSIPMPAVAGIACRNLLITDEKQYKLMVEKVKQYIRSSAKRRGRYEITRGRNGGVRLRHAAPGLVKHEVKATFTVMLEEKATKKEVRATVRRYLKNVKGMTYEVLP